LRLRYQRKLKKQYNLLIIKTNLINTIFGGLHEK